MVALLLYSYSRGHRSSRRIERSCVEDIACRVICVNEVPDHTTIARFRQRHQDAIAGLFSDVLRLCADAGLVGVGLVAVDGTKVHADASHHDNRDYEQIAREILAEADAVDAQEDEQFGDRRGDELPLELQTGRGRQEWLRAGRKRLEAQRDDSAKPIPASRPAAGGIPSLPQPRQAGAPQLPCRGRPSAYPAEVCIPMTARSCSSSIVIAAL
ncbi:MAG: transposase [Thermoleophilia bacterium]